MNCLSWCYRRLYGNDPNEVERDAKKQKELIKKLDTYDLTNLSSQDTLELAEIYKELKEVNQSFEHHLQDIRKHHRSCKKISCAKITAIATCGTGLLSFGLMIAGFVVKYTSDVVYAINPQTLLRERVITPQYELGVNLLEASSAVANVFQFFGCANGFLTEKKNRINAKIEKRAIILNTAAESHESFLKAFNEFKASQDAKDLKRCLECHKRVNQSEAKSRILSEELVPQLIHYLPEEDPLRLDLNSLTKSVYDLRAKRKESDSDESAHPDHSFTSERSATKDLNKTPQVTAIEKLHLISITLGIELPQIRIGDFIFKDDGTIIDSQQLIPDFEEWEKGHPLSEFVVN